MKEKIPCAERLREALGLRDLRQSDLCELTGIPKSAMSQYVSGAFEPKQDRVELMAKALNVTEAWLMGYDVPMEHVKIDPEQGGWAGCSYYEQYEGEHGRRLLEEEIEYEKKLAEKDGKLLKILHSDDRKTKLVQWISGLDERDLDRIEKLLDAVEMLPKE
jgi:transcriptional regulator with XRE-family HTH domain